MKSFGKNNCKLPSHPPQLVNTDYQKRIEQYESALCKALDTVKVLEAEVERKNRMINDLATSTASSIDIETVKKIIKDVSEKELRERAKKIELRELEAEIREQERLKEDEQEALEFKELMEEQKHSLEVIQNEVGRFEDVLKKSIKQPEPSYLKPTKLSESRKDESLAQLAKNKKKGK
jgi:hypothetical protein